MSLFMKKHVNFFLVLLVVLRFFVLPELFGESLALR